MIPRVDGNYGVLMTSSHVGFESALAPGSHALCPHAAGRPPTFCNNQAGGTLSQQPWARKYVILCFLCGGLAVLLGVVLMGIYFTLRSYTSSLHFFETIPTYVPAVVLIITGLLIMCFAKRRNRYSYLIKLTGACLLICTLLCVVITVSTTVIHMSRLQTLRECVYAQKAKTCTCFSGSAGPDMADTSDGSRFVFNNTPNCEAIHGSLYSCLRGLFGLSVVGILICIFSSMLVYQLLAHERKKTYWEQMELRRRFFYRRHPHYPYCGCYDEIYPWYPWEIMDDPLWRMSPTGRQTQAPTNNILPTRHPPPSGRQTYVQRRTSILRWLPWPWRCSTEIESLGHGESGNQTSSVTDARVRDRVNNFTDFRLIDRNVVTSRTVTHSRRTEEITSSAQTTNSSSVVSNHRRRRSNDTVLHHLNFVNRYQNLLVSNQRGRNFYSSSQIGEFSLPRHMWGPPPPYPHSPIIEYNDQNLNTRRTRTSTDTCQRLNEEPAQDGNQVSAPLLDMVQSIESTETFNIGDETKRHTSDVEINGGEIHILTVDVHPNREYINEEAEDKEDRDRPCLVEIHVPYVDEVINKKDEIKNVSSFTLPLRHSKKLADITPFKSLSNIPLYLSNKLSTFQQESENSCNLDEANMEMLEESLMQKLCQFSDDSVMPDGRYVLSDGVLSTLCSSSNGSPVSENMPSSPEFGPTIVELFTDYKSRIVIATTPCTPVHDDVLLGDSVCVTRSMPNLYCSACVNSGPVTASTSCCSGSASSIGCSTTSLPDDIFSVEDTVPQSRPHRVASSRDLRSRCNSPSKKDDQNGNPLVGESYPIEYFITSSSSSSEKTYNPIRRRKKRPRAVIIRRSAMNDSYSSSSDYNEPFEDSALWTERNAQSSTADNQNYQTLISNHSSEFCDTSTREGPGISSMDISFISVNQT